MGCVTPVFKNGDKSSVECYRPISTLPVYSKIFEKYMHNCMMEFIKRHKIICNKQFGFQKSKSTQTAIISFFEDCMNL